MVEKNDNSPEENRMEKLKELTKTLSDRYKSQEISSEKFKWLMKNLKDAILFSKNNKNQKEDLIDMLEDLICAVEEEEDKDE